MELLASSFKYSGRCYK